MDYNFAWLGTTNATCIANMEACMPKPMANSTAEL